MENPEEGKDLPMLVAALEKTHSNTLKEQFRTMYPLQVDETLSFSLGYYEPEHLLKITQIIRRINTDRDSQKRISDGSLDGNLPTFTAVLSYVRAEKSVADWANEARAKAQSEC
ncbi:hypothetical protein [cf. Phormidesmis sp. LEGE 11477]|uniref:hypothetical protein n=1 Tax=cf. Phormidesmis sp. LEGE 11477 TaxID=1828680 RepID=UPI00187FDA6A|nr:hypothetical protein [cf. Phormidesmis sp. LEGE 11477]MBE9063431.1 hypothetical protein [cf. Phormidesmis sp. LEGE 11477]